MNTKNIVEQNSTVTLDDLAVMIANGFREHDQRFAEMNGRFAEMNGKLG